MKFAKSYKPRHWVIAWLLMPILSSFFLMLIVSLNHKKFNYQTKKAFHWCITSFAFTLPNQTDGTSVSISILVLFFWTSVTVLVICCLNYLPRVHWTKTGFFRCTLACRWKDCLIKNSTEFYHYLVGSCYVFCRGTCLT